MSLKQTLKAMGGDASPDETGSWGTVLQPILDIAMMMVFPGSRSGGIGKSVGGKAAAGEPMLSIRISVDDALKALPKGKNPGVKTVGSENELRDLYKILSQGGTRIEVPSYSGSWVQRPDGVRVGIRDTSKSTGSTIDIKYTDGTSAKVHISK